MNTPMYTSQKKDTSEEDRLCLLCGLGEIENKDDFLSCCPVYDDLWEKRFIKMSPIYADFFWLDEYEKLELCFWKGTFFVANFLCQAWERRIFGFVFCFRPSCKLIFCPCKEKIFDCCSWKFNVL